MPALLGVGRSTTPDSSRRLRAIAGWQPAYVVLSEGFEPTPSPCKSEALPLRPRKHSCSGYLLPNFPVSLRAELLLTGSPLSNSCPGGRTPQLVPPEGLEPPLLVYQTSALPLRSQGHELLGLPITELPGVNPCHSRSPDGLLAAAGLSASFSHKRAARTGCLMNLCGIPLTALPGVTPRCVRTWASRPFQSARRGDRTSHLVPRQRLEL